MQHTSQMPLASETAATPRAASAPQHHRLGDTPYSWCIHAGQVHIHRYSTCGKWVAVAFGWFFLVVAIGCVVFGITNMAWALLLDNSARPAVGFESLFPILYGLLPGAGAWGAFKAIKQIPTGCIKAKLPIGQGFCLQTDQQPTTVNTSFGGTMKGPSKRVLTIHDGQGRCIKTLPVFVGQPDLAGINDVLAGNAQSSVCGAS